MKKNNYVDVYIIISLKVFTLNPLEREDVIDISYVEHNNILLQLKRASAADFSTNNLKYSADFY